MSTTLLIFLIIGIIIAAMMLVCIYMCSHFLRSLNDNRVRDIETALRLINVQKQWIWSQLDTDDQYTHVNVGSYNKHRHKPRKQSFKVEPDDIDYNNGSITSI